jgi:hypothetical protein
MISSLELKITISEFATPALFQAMSAVSNPRQRAALLKRLAEEALRGNVSIGHAAPATSPVLTHDHVPTSPPAQSQPPSRSHPPEPKSIGSQTSAFDEDRERLGERPFGRRVAGVQIASPGTRHGSS